MDPVTISSIMNVMKEFLPPYTSVAVADSEKFIYYQPSKLVDLRIRAGEPYKAGSGAAKAIAERHEISEYIDSDVYGIPYYAVSVPLFNDAQVVGAVTTIFPAKPSPIAANFFTIKSEDCWYPVAYENIVYLEAENRKTKVQSVSGEGYHKMNLTELEFMLPNDYFIRVHRSYIVNVKHIEEIQPDSHSTFLLVMKDRTKIPVSQTYASSFRKALNF
ncbi:LytR family transcriptional regulator [Bacillus sp. FJAT-27231]|uniref:LytTR family DNA-binding domain-containing protein n=1 Tax=Bacillus sp. FJAT-27231 TaxID=1679168 RepID=UPI0006712CFB|nr:LytTR family DNA-binding domain-containing protein [Bacillus sp. FJAT-27231]KMY55731.1 LytR family transcriptional regulator [Bacillus sp. FJAT-27231]